MDMIGHEAIANQRYSVQRNVFPQQIEVDRTISIGIQHESSRVSTLGHVVGSMDRDHAGQTRHESLCISIACHI